MSPILDTDSLSKSYGTTEALKSVSLQMQAGEPVALLGCNGAGKSTLIELMTGRVVPTSGRVKLFGLDPSDHQARLQFRYLPQELHFPVGLKMGEILRTVEGQLGAQLDRKVIEALDLGHLLDQQCHSLSGGEQRKLAVALNLVGSAKLLILDEPTANIDVVARHRIYQILSEYQCESGTAVLFSSHELSEIDKLANRVVVLHKGQVVADDSIIEVRKQFAPTRIEFNSNTENLPNLPAALKAERFRNRFTLYSDQGDLALKQVIESIPDATDITVNSSGLEEAFLHLWEGRQ